MALKTVKEGFTAFLLNLAPTNTENKKVASHEGSVKGYLNKHFSCDKLIATGSFGLGTSIRHESDSDYFAVIPATNKISNSANFLAKIKVILQSEYKTTSGIKVNSPVVCIPFGNYASETMEVVPAFFNGFADTRLKKFRIYNIPDGNGEWMAASPESHNKYVTDNNSNFQDNGLKKLIQLIKAWKYYNKVEIHSFYLELQTVKCMEKRTTIDFARDVYKVLKYLQDKELADMNDPMEISGQIAACKTQAKKKIALTKLKTAVVLAKKALDAEKDKKTENAFNFWNLLFKNQFPNR